MTPPATEPTGDTCRRTAAIRVRQARVEAANRARVHRVLDAARTTGTPVSFAEVKAETGFSSNTVTKHTRTYMSGVVAELMGREVPDDEAFRAWMALNAAFANHVRTSGATRAVQDRQLRLVIEHLDRAGRPITANAVYKLATSGTDRVKHAIEAWEAETGRRRSRATSWELVTLEMVLPLIDPALRRLPLTSLAHPGAYPPVAVTTLRLIAGLAPPCLRNTAFLCLAIHDARSRNDDRFFGALAEYLPALGMADIDEIEPDRFYPAFHDGRLLPEVPTPVRTHRLQTYFRLLRKQETYFERLTPEQAGHLAPFRLRGVTSSLFWRRSPLARQVEDEQRGRRKAATAAIHDKFYLFRNIAERRLNQLVHLRQAFRDACDQARRNPQVSFPLAFAYTEEAVTPAGSARTVTHRFRLWDGHTLCREHAPLVDRRYYGKRKAKRGHDRCNGSFFLSYEGSTAERETVEQAQFWFADLVRAGGFTHEPNPAFLAAHGYSTFSAIFPPARPDWDSSNLPWVKRVAADLGLLLLPAETLLATGLIGHASLQTMTKTGARVGELLQIRLTREHLTLAKLPGDKEVIAFRAMPKGRETEEPFYIDARCLGALHGWFAFLREHEGGAAVIKPSLKLRDKCKPAPYLFQFARRHFDAKHINACLRVLLHGVDVSTAEGKTVRLSTHLLRHGFATEMRALDVPLDLIAELLKQRDVEVTRYYAKPTPAQMHSVQERIFVDRIDLTRTHLRAPAEIRRQLEEARGKVGAHIRVLGGTCTDPGWCPAKYACVGCAANAPDPARRGEVDEFKVLYEATVNLACRQGLPAEESKARARVAAAEDMLAEMDLIEAAKLDAARLADVRFGEPHPSGKRQRLQ